MASDNLKYHSRLPFVRPDALQPPWDEIVDIRGLADALPSPPASAPAADVTARVRPGANRPTRGLVVRRVRDRFRMRDV